MTTNTDIFHRAGVDAPTDEKARQAVKAFRALQPTLTAYARNLTKRSDVIVEMAAHDNGSTDGKKIFYRPPIALGEQRPHDRRQCDKRDENKQLLCEACMIREDVLTTIYHEIGHIAFESFALVSKDDIELTMRKAIEEVGTKYARKIEQALDSAPSYVKDSYIGISNFVSPFLPFLVNCLEDARVNTEMFKARPGTKVMFDASTTRIFAEGVEQVDRTTGEIKTIKWCDYPANAQVTLGVFCIASGYTFTGWFAPQVEEALKDAELTRLVRQIDTVRSAAGVYHLAFPVLARLRELGYCKSDKDPEDEPEPEEQPDEASDDEPGVDESDEENDEPSEAEESGDGDASQDPSEPDADSGGSDSEESRGEGDSDEGPAPSGEGADADTDAGESDAGEPEENPGDGDAGSDAGAGDDDAEPSDEGGADTDPTGTGLDGDAEGDDGVDEPDADEAGEGAGDHSDAEESEELGGDAAGTEGEEGDADDGEAQDSTGTGEAGESTAEIGSGDIDGPSLDEGTGGEQDADRGGEDREGSDDSTDGPAEGEDVPGGDGDEDGGDLDGDGPGADEPADAGSAGVDEVDPTEALDSGADNGEGGTELIENEANDDLPLGDPSDVEYALIKLGDHEDKPKTMEEQRAEEAVDRAIIQGLYFETPSRRIYGVREHHHGSPILVEGYNVSQAWDLSGSAYAAMGFYGSQLGRDGDFHAPESILGPALVRMRVAFSENARGKNERNLKSGKVNGKVLGKRAWNGDERLFRKRSQPGKRNYFVALGMDVSGSTVGRNIVLEKRAVMAQATLLKRMGIQFSIFAHSGNLHSPGSGRSSGFDLDVYLVKEAHEPWDEKIQQRLLDLGPDSANLDGHFLEYLVRKCDEVQATDKIILYYSDGKMPAENHDEELEILQRELRKCAMKKYTVLGVGIRTDSPARHGLDTVQVDTDDDIVKVVRHLEKRLR